MRMTRLYLALVLPPSNQSSTAREISREVYGTFTSLDKGDKGDKREKSMYF